MLLVVWVLLCFGRSYLYSRNRKPEDILRPYTLSGGVGASEVCRCLRNNIEKVMLAHYRKRHI